jgi:hypothetical protein
VPSCSASSWVGLRPFDVFFVFMIFLHLLDLPATSRPFKIVPCRYELPHVVPSCYGALRCNPVILKISIISVFICIFLSGVPPHLQGRLPSPGVPAVPCARSRLSSSPSSLPRSVRFRRSLLPAFVSFLAFPAFPTFLEFLVLPGEGSIPCRTQSWVQVS